MRFASIIVAYNEPDLTSELYQPLCQQTVAHDVFILDNSSHLELVTKSPTTLDVGRDNLGWGGCHEWFIRHGGITNYDFVGFWNTDVTDVPPDLLERICRYDLSPVGAFSPSINDAGTGWDFMRRQEQHGLRTVPLLESIAWYCRPIHLLNLLQHAPLPTCGWWIDIVTCGYVKLAGQKCVVCDDVRVEHIGRHKRRLGRGLELMGNIPSYAPAALEEAIAWVKRSGAQEVYRQGHEGYCFPVDADR